MGSLHQLFNPYGRLQIGRTRSPVLKGEESFLIEVSGLECHPANKQGIIPSLFGVSVYEYINDLVATMSDGI